jgi:hypothetical protein
MKSNDYSTSFAVAQSAQEAFAAINNVRGWWSEDIEGRTDEFGARFKYRYKDVHLCTLTLQIIEFVPAKRVVWLVLNNYFSFTEDKTEWKGTKIIFDIASHRESTEVRFTHLGLVPDDECYSACSRGWSAYIKSSLRQLIASGSGHPNVGKAITESERALS